MLMEEAGISGWSARHFEHHEMVAMLLHTSGMMIRKTLPGAASCRPAQNLARCNRAKSWIERVGRRDQSGRTVTSIICDASKLWITNGIWGDFGILSRRLTFHMRWQNQSLSRHREETTYDASACRR